ncbi:MAG TPA: Z1 domain-containing protein [Candidatus Omnitrophota bacterium]|nr:Z1 domain-containing protein [Candidatus Omnitrophota bacterium]
MGIHSESYLKIVDQMSSGVAPSIRATVDALIPQYIKTFSFNGHITGLLLGNVQSGKTGQVFGIISAAADEGFDFFIFLTTDSVYLHEQTLKRALGLLDTFVVCGEDDDIRFIEAKMRKPVIIVLKKNTKVLKRWKNNISASKFCEGRGLFIVDDEGDAASLNTKINKKQQSTINNHLEGIKKLANSSIYLQVTATPQSLLLQSQISGWRPSFIHYFPPGRGYLGGDFFYSEPPSSCIRLTKENELDDLRREEQYIADGLRLSLLSFLVSGSHIMISRAGEGCNFLVHPSVRIADHERIAKKLGEYLNQMLVAVSEDKMGDYLKESWDDLRKTKRDLIDFDKVHNFIKQQLNDEKIKRYIMNSTGSNISTADCVKGLNIIVGGNSLGRGVTFPALQTVYYCRTAKCPQADTFWQHCRMFGYDRDPDLMRLYLPPSLLKLFIELNSGNRALLGQVVNQNINDISLLYPPKIRPTRANVIDKDILDVIVGGVNYFPNFPKHKFVKQIDDMLTHYSGHGTHETTLNGIISLLEKFESESKSDWSNKAFINCIKALKASSAENKAILIIRRDRSIGKGTGTLLSPDDRALGESIKNYTVLTLYRAEGEKEKGWEGLPLWIPNIKLPAGKNFYRVDN